MKKRRSKKQTATTKPTQDHIRNVLNGCSCHELRELRKLISKKIGSLQRKPKLYPLGTKKDSIPVFSTASGAYNHIMSDDWSQLFQGTDNDNNDYYVYYHSNPRFTTGKKVSVNGVDYKLRMPFYIGMGRGNRMFNFNRSVKHSKLLNSLTRDGFCKTEIAFIASHSLSKSLALELESKLILFWGCIHNSTANSMYGGQPCLFNDRYEPYPDEYNRLNFSHKKFQEGRL